METTKANLVETINKHGLHNMVVEANIELHVEVTALDMNFIRIKFHGFMDDKGPDMIIDEAMARAIIRELQLVLPEGK
ncbi:MAG: hypothetical protein ACRYGG_00375 [Janthinobacterium lividum]